MAKHPKESVQPKEEEQRKNFVLKEKEQDLDEGLESFESALAIKFETEEEEERVAENIRTEIDEILEDRKDLETEWDAADDAYDGNLPDKTFPFEDCSNCNVPIISEKVDAVASRIEEGVWSVEPLWIVKPLKGSTIESCEKKEKVLDYTARREMELEQELDNVFFDATNKGTGILEVPYKKEFERITDVEKYKGNKKGLREFLDNYPEPPEKENQRKLYDKFLNRLKNNEDIDVLVEYDESVWNGPDPRHVPLKDFIVPLHIKNLRKAHLCGKRIWLTGNDLNRMVADGRYDEERVNKLRYWVDKKGERHEVEGFLTKDFEIFILIYKYDHNQDGLEERCLIDYAYEDKKILKAINYPYWHKRPYFIPFYISSQTTGFYRVGLARMLEDIQVLANVIVNLLVDSATVAAVPSFKALEGAKSYLAPQLNKGWYPGVTFWIQAQTDLEQIPIVVPQLGIMVTLAAMVEKYGELRSGVSQYMTGKESPLDPNAPARKAMILLREANLRISKYINNIQHSMSEVAYQFIELYYQFMPEGKEYEITDQRGAPAFPKISREELRQKAIYVPHGSIAVFTRALEKEINEELFTMIDQHPLIQANPIGRRFLLETLIKSQGGEWDKQVSKILPTAEQFKEQMIEITKEAMRRQQAEDAEKGRRMQELVKSGVPEQEAVRMIEEEDGKRKEELAKQEGKVG